MKSALTVAHYTFRELLKSRITLNVLVLGLLIAGITYVASEFTYGVPSRIALDFGLGTLSITLLGVAIFLGVGLLAKEIENRTIYMVLSRPVSRNSFLIGRILGMLGIQVVNSVILSCFSLSIYFLWDGEPSSVIFWAYFFTFLESLLVLLIVVTFSLLANPIISVCNTIILLFCGHYFNDAKVTSFAKNSPILSKFLSFYGITFPNFDKINIKSFVLYKQSLTPEYLWTNLAYVFFYSVFLVVLCAFIFKRKNLD